MDLHHIRDDYCKQTLSLNQCHPDPKKQFEQWLNEAIHAKVHEPTAMHLATVQAGRPTGRMVLLKELNTQGFVFFTNYHSRKGQAIAENPYVALTFFWAELERSVRVEGKIEKLSAKESDAYFTTRPYTSKIGAWASEQSQPLRNKQTLVAKAALLATKYPINVPRPPYWGGYVVVPERIEFWQGRPSRLHDRIYYQLENGQWQKIRLSP